MDRASASHDLSKNGSPWGIPGAQVDGMDVLAVKDGGRRRRRALPRRQGALLLEMQTYRYRGHSMSDPARYRTARRGAEDAQPARLHRECAPQLDAIGVTEAEFEGDRRRGEARSCRMPPISRSPAPNPTRAELFTDVLLEG